jgi:tetratricopeptide (TPR) repeat protein
LALCDLGRYEEAMQSFEQALTIAPDDSKAKYNQSLCRLLAGDFEAGWRQYEARWEIEQFLPFKRDFTQPQWLGEPCVKGRTILLHAEQGIGDTIQFCRYAPLVARLGARVFLEVPKPLVALLSQLDGLEQVFATGESPAAFDYHCPLMSLPRAFRTNVDSIPASMPYLFADGARVAVWQQRLGEQKKRRIGLVWSGNPGHRNDRNRSVPLSLFAKLLENDCEFVSLQKVLRDSDKMQLGAVANVRHFGELLTDFSDTAALLACMDMVITADTAVAHLAGAMEKPVWILVPFNPDWRWMINRGDTPWYPSARLFRQRKAGDWQNVLKEVSQAMI